MAQPVYSQLTPEDGAQDGDLIGVSLIWTRGDPGDNLDTTSFTIERDSVEYPCEFLALGGGAYRVSADVGLFPDEVGITITAFAQSLAGDNETVTWSFDARTSSQMTQAAEVNTRFIAGARALAELPNVNPEIGFATLLTQLTVMPDYGNFTQTDFRAVEFGSSADAALAQITAARAFLILATLIAVGSGRRDISSNEQAMASDQGQSRISGGGLFDATAGQLSINSRHGLNAGRMNVGEPGARSSLTAGREHVEPATEAGEVITGSGIDSHFVISDETLDSLNDD